MASCLRACFILALVLGSVAGARVIKEEDLAVHRELIDAINADATSTFVAGENEFFKGKTTLEEAKRLMGTVMTLNDTFLSSQPKKTFDHIRDSDIPTSFDARSHWPGFIQEIRNQQQCGSCWAFGAVEALGDRFAIASNGSVNVVLSPEDLVSCDEWELGCNGGLLNIAWSYLTNHGAVSDECFPYSAGNGRVPPCTIKDGKCELGVEFRKYKTKNYYHIEGVRNIQKAILTGGPVEAAFIVHQSFMSYKSGVYQKPMWEDMWPLGGHAVKILGWGVQDGQDYWLVANSWGPYWGLDGYFLIK